MWIFRHRKARDPKAVPQEWYETLYVTRVDGQERHEHIEFHNTRQQALDRLSQLREKHGLSGKPYPS